MRTAIRDWLADRCVTFLQRVTGDHVQRHYVRVHVPGGHALEPCWFPSVWQAKRYAADCVKGRNIVRVSVELEDGTRVAELN